MKAEKISLDDALTLEFVRLLEGGREPSALGLAPGANDEVQGTLVERSRLLLPQYTPLTPRRLKLFIRLFLLLALAIALLLGMTIFPLAKAARMLEGYEVNLAGPFFFFMAGQLLFLFISLCFFVVTVLSLPLCLLKRRKLRVRKMSLLGSFLFGFMGSMIITAAFWCAGTLLKWNLALFHGTRKQSTTRDAASTGKEVDAGTNDWEKNMRLFTDYFAGRARPILFFSGVCTHLFWFAMSGTMLLLLLFQMQSNEYKYRWKTSLGDVRQVHAVMETWGRPLSYVCPIPTTEDVQWLFQESAAPASTQSVPASVSPVPASVQATSHVRARWSFFLLACVLFYAVVPRVFLTLGYLLLFRWSIRDYRPDWNEPYYQALIDRIQPHRVRSELVRHADETEEELEQERRSRFAYLEDQRRAVATSAADDSALTPAKANKTLLLAYETELGPEKWQFLSPLADDAVTFENVAASRSSLAAFRDFMKEHAEEMTLCLVLTDCSIPPARQTLRFLYRDLLDLLPRETPMYVLLSCGEQLRRKFPPDSAAPQQRLADWRQSLEELATTREHKVIPVSCYDHQLNLPSARRQLLALFTPTSGAGHVRDSESRADEAFALVRNEVKALFATPAHAENGQDAEQEQLLRMTNLYRNLTALYQEENRSWLTAARGRLASWLHRSDAEQHESDVVTAEQESQEGVNATRTPLAALAQESNRLGLGLTDVTEKLGPTLELVTQTKQFCSRLSPGWALGAASVGAAIPVAVTLAPLLGGTLTLSALAGVVGGLGTLLPSTVAGGAAGAVVGAAIPASWQLAKERIRTEFLARFARKSNDDASDMPPDSLSEQAVQVHTLVASAAVWIAVFELQGRPEEEIVDAMPRLLLPLETAVCSSPEVTDTILNSLQTNLTAYPTKAL
ncbi:MAG: DUF2868 domain-containing protein [Planctomycetia bacterium]|nr:DUF2868 domain-containing protein [Planctomycetia bacterium]